MTTSSGAGDLARRVRKRRLELGLSTAEVAERAGMAPGYLEYLEEAVPFLTYGSLMRLAAALQTTPELLAGAGIDRAAGRGGAAPSPLLEELDPDECRVRLEGGGVGRIVFVDESGPTALPVNFRLLDGDVVFRTSEHGAIAHAVQADGATVAFEVDHIDDTLREGWSVLVHGQARRIDDEAELERARALRIEPWAGGDRDVYLRVATTSTSGRRIRAG